MSADFNRGICDQCFKTIFRLDDKYRIGKVVKWGVHLAWQWYCNGCGAVHHERCNIVRHGEWPEREVVAKMSSSYEDHIKDTFQIHKDCPVQCPRSALHQQRVERIIRSEEDEE